MWHYITYDELYHHGIKGQKWGVRNGPPYPLKGANKRAANIEKPNKSRKINANSSYGAIPPELIEAGAMIAMSLAMYTIAYVDNRIKINKDIKKNMSNNSFKDIKIIDGDHTKEEDQKAINPNYGNDLEHGMNCVLCSTAYELRRRGYDVEANGTEMGRQPSNVLKYFNLSKADVHYNRKYEKFKKDIESMPDGSRGNLMTGVMSWDSRHSMVWEKENGRVIIRDCQTNEVYKSLDSSIINKRSSAGYRFIRTDNAIINEEAIMDAVKPRRDDTP